MPGAHAILEEPLVQDVAPRSGVKGIVALSFLLGVGLAVTLTSVTSREQQLGQEPALDMVGRIPTLNKGATMLYPQASVLSMQRFLAPGQRQMWPATRSQGAVTSGATKASEDKWPVKWSIGMMQDNLKLNQPGNKAQVGSRVFCPQWVQMGPWVLGPHETAVVTEVDESGYFKAKNPAGLESTWLTPFDYQFDTPLRQKKLE
jgi:hypothetical protein